MKIFFLLIFLVFAFGRKLCPHQYKAFKEKDQRIHCYRIHKAKKTWNQAKRICRNDLGYLPLPKTKHDNTQLKKLLSDKVGWIGIQYDKQYGVWEDLNNNKLDTRKFLQLRHFFKGVNDFNSKNCGIMKRNGEWENANCHQKRHFVCESQNLFYCPKGYTLKFDKHLGKHCLKLFKRKTTWSRAAKICKKNKANLVLPTDKYFNRGVKHLVPKGKLVWLNVNNFKDRMIWKTRKFSPRKGFFYREKKIYWNNWIDKPFSYKRKCGVQRKGKWIPHSCKKNQYFICEKVL